MQSIFNCLAGAALPFKGGTRWQGSMQNLFAMAVDATVACVTRPDATATSTLALLLMLVMHFRAVTQGVGVCGYVTAQLPHWSQTVSRRERRSSSCWEVLHGQQITRCGPKLVALGSLALSRMVNKLKCFQCY